MEENNYPQKSWSYRKYIWEPETKPWTCSHTSEFRLIPRGIVKKESVQNVVKGITRKGERKTNGWLHITTAKRDQVAKEISEEILQTKVFKFTEADEGRAQRRDADTRGRSKISGEEKFKGLKIFPQGVGNGAIERRKVFLSNRVLCKFVTLEMWMYCL